MQVASSPQSKPSSLKAIGESDSSSIFRQLPATGLVLYRAMCLMLLKAWKTLLSWFTFFTVVVEPSDGRPSPFSRSLTRHRVELVRPRKLFGENFAICAQFVASNLLVVHPIFDARVPDKTRSTNGLIKPLILLFLSLKFCFKYQHFTSLRLV